MPGAVQYTVAAARQQLALDLRPAPVPRGEEAEGRVGRFYLAILPPPDLRPLVAAPPAASGGTDAMGIAEANEGDPM